jgi:hypothetical protein
VSICPAAKQNKPTLRASRPDSVWGAQGLGIRLSSFSAACKAVKRRSFTARVKPCPSFDSLAQPLKVSDGFLAN